MVAVRRFRQRPFPRARALVVAAALAFSLAACAAEADDGLVARDTGPTAAAGPGPLTIATSFRIDNLDPLENAFWGPEFGYVELLMRPEPNGVPSPWVLQSLTNVDETTWKLTLREGVKFENGKTLDAESLAELIEFCDEENAGFAAAVNLDDAEVTGPLEVTLTTTQPVPGMANILADEANVPVFDVDAYAQHQEAGKPVEDLLDAGLYTGPYAMKSLTSERAELEPMPGYWDGTPGLSHLTIKFVPEATARVQAVQAGEADIALYMPTTMQRNLQGRSDAFFVAGPPNGTTFALQINNARAPYDDPTVRQALLAAIDYRALAEDVLNGLAEVATSSMTADADYVLDLQATDLDKAKRLLDEAGWTAAGSGPRTKDGQKLTLEILTYPQQPDSNTIGVALQAQLKDLGFEVKVSQVPDITEARKGSDWDVAIVGDSILSFTLSPVDGLRQSLHSDSPENYSKVDSPALDAVISELGREFDATKRTELLRRAQQIIADEGLWAATVRRKGMVVTNAKWRNYPLPVANLWVTARTAP
ncbi:ABC transporter substrate-binding protein [Sporichthya brevicatena]|uniref:ABC transporter substrate-binding protein n=1 Tax=Sporichthya brevicatena TaxID=171442 RepID=A0ABP3SDU4_9ACTN